MSQVEDAIETGTENETEEKKRGRKSKLTGVGDVFATLDDAKNSPPTDPDGETPETFRVYTVTDPDTNEYFVWAVSAVFAMGYVAEHLGFECEVSEAGKRGRGPATLDSQFFSMIKMVWQAGDDNYLETVLSASEIKFGAEKINEIRARLEKIPRNGG